MLTWPPTTEDFQHYMHAALEGSDKQHVKVLVFADNPTLLIYDPIVQTIQSQYKIGTAKSGERTVEVLIAEKD